MGQIMGHDVSDLFRFLPCRTGDDYRRSKTEIRWRCIYDVCIPTWGGSCRTRHVQPPIDALGFDNICSKPYLRLDIISTTFHDNSWWQLNVKWCSTKILFQPIDKVNIFRSTKSHISTTPRHLRAVGCLATENIECGTFTDRSDCILVGANNLYLVDLRVQFTCPNLQLS